MHEIRLFKRESSGVLTPVDSGSMIDTRSREILKNKAKSALEANAEADVAIIFEPDGKTEVARVQKAA